MIAVVLATLSALSYGASDFSGAVASKDQDASVIVVAAQIVSLMSLLTILALFPEDHRAAADLAWGAVAGLGVAIGLVTFYRALASGPMSTAASLTALVSAAVPVLAGLALGDRPNTITLLGVAVAIPATVLVSIEGRGLHGTIGPVTPGERVAERRRRNETRTLAIIAGLGFAGFFIALSRVSEDAGLFPLVGARTASIAALAGFLSWRRRWSPVAKGSWAMVGVAGVLDCAANSFYISALDFGSFVWVAAISSLYPATTVVLAAIVLHERLGRIQIVGLAMAGAALLVIAIGNA